MKKGFPEDFLWGGAIAASQADGAYDQEERDWTLRTCGILTRPGRRKSGPCTKIGV